METETKGMTKIPETILIRIKLKQTVSDRPQHFQQNRRDGKLFNEPCAFRTISCTGTHKFEALIMY
jgi:hypothetical protein